MWPACMVARLQGHRRMCVISGAHSPCAMKLQSCAYAAGSSLHLPSSRSSHSRLSRSRHAGAHPALGAQSTAATIHLHSSPGAGKSTATPWHAPCRRCTSAQHHPSLRPEPGAHKNTTTPILTFFTSAVGARKSTTTPNRASYTRCTRT
eukprot:1126837-Pelagomonas_calceolata.AAC.5